MLFFIKFINQSLKILCCISRCSQLHIQQRSLYHFQPFFPISLQQLTMSATAGEYVFVFTGANTQVNGGLLHIV